ncbi:uncharacterized protein IAS62_001179 [Cryptococcus decagattii]|uniref:Bacteriophage T5 Orf172 DNA-binding domain-containing protein n=1 Tax=Cryptococcus decagattii TaxID=1859122 RepID=A0ABZ2APR5_9TREE
MSHLTGSYQRQLYRPDSTASSSNVHHIHPLPYHPPTRYHRIPQQPPPTSYSPSQSSAQAALAAQALRSRGNEYLLSLTTSVNNLQLHDGIKSSDRSSRVPEHFSRTHRAAPRPSSSSPNYNKQLPPLPLPDVVPSHHYSAGLPNVTASQGSFPFQNTPLTKSSHSERAPDLAVSRDDSVPAVEERPTSNTYRNVVHNLSVMGKPVFPKMRPQTSPAIAASVNEKGKANPLNNKEEVTSKSKSLQANHPFSAPEGARHDSVIDLTQISDHSDSPPSGPAKENVTPRSSTTPMKATSDLRRSFLTSPSPLSTSPTGRGSSNTPSTISPMFWIHTYRSTLQAGFYWRRERDSSGVWIEFDDYIPEALGQQTQTLLRMTMETKLTPKECAGFLYAYELKDLETSELSFYKVGRTDNVPRRIGQWTNRCQSKRPTLLDIFPRPSVSTRPSVTSSLHRSDTLTTSFLPGATTHRTPPLPAMKRWERLVHLELSERCASHPLSEQAYERVRMKCKDCGTVHREIFPLIKVHQGHRIAYEEIVECVERWGKFIKVICEEM